MRFKLICDLLVECLDNSNTPGSQNEIIKKWFRTHRSAIDQTDKLALLSTLLPHRRHDRVYNLQQKSLEKVISRALCLGKSQLHDLGRWRQPGTGDLGDCVERSTRNAGIVELSESKQVTVEEIDTALSRIASGLSHSAPEVRSLIDPFLMQRPDEVLQPLMLCLQPRELKWLTRLILKNFAPIELPERVVAKLLHPLLPKVLESQCELPAALRTLDEHLATEATVGTNSETTFRKIFQPEVGVKIGRQTFHKARSIKHCVTMAKRRRMALQRKYDGYYVQVHINMANRRNNQIKLFSKKGKNCTGDRRGLHLSIRQSLRLDDPDCPISKNCILEGEMMVYDDKEQKILDFYEIRKHVSFGGSRAIESSNEHLMIVFFDMMFLNDVSMLLWKQHQRMETLESIILQIPGRAALAEQYLLDFSKTTAASELRDIFAKCIVRREEGLVMKPADDAYFSSAKDSAYQSCSIKLKKEYIGGFGDVGDFAVVAAAYNAQKAKSIPIPDLRWTDFYIGCLENKEDVVRNMVSPRYVVVTTVTPSLNILKQLPRVLTWSEPYRSDDLSLRIEPGVAQGVKPSVIFPRPIVFDLYCFAFDRDFNTNFWTLRFPQVSKLHSERTHLDTVSFQELQCMAEDARLRPDNRNSQEELEWVQKLNAADPRGIAVDVSSTQDSMGTGISYEATNNSCPTSPPVRLTPSPNSLSNSGVTLDKTPGRKRKSNQQRDDQYYSSPKRFKLSAVPEGLDMCSRKVLKPPSSNFAQSRRPLHEIVNNSGYTRTTSLGLVRSRSPHFSAVQDRIRHPRSLNARAKLLKDTNYLTPPNEDRITPLTLRTIKASDDKNNISHTIQENTNIPQSSDVSLSITEMRSLGNSKPSLRSVPHSRMLAFCVFALSPCVASLAATVKKIISCHGGTTVNDPREWLDSSKFLNYCPLSGNRMRKVILVDKRRKELTLDYLKTVEEFGVGGQSDKREWIEVYDWRLLESIDKSETLESMPELWKRQWIGAI